MATNVSRRRFLAAVGVGTLACHGSHLLGADGLLPVTAPRATAGDRQQEPDWAERLSVSVGPRDADLVGRDDRVIQAALDYIVRRGGGTVRLLPGTYTLRNAVFLPSHTRLLGSGAESILTKIPSETIPLGDDSNWFDQEITLQRSGSFRVGDGVLLTAKNPHHGGRDVIKRTLVARSGTRYKLDHGLRENLWISGNPTCSSLFPLLTSERESDVTIENLTLDGNLANNENLNGNYGGCIFLQDCNRFTIRGVEAHDYNGDGISFQVCHDVRVLDCYCHDNANLGVHPGSGSQRPLIRGSRMDRNNLGLFWCWGVKYGLAEDNQMDANRSYGISIGHCDTDNVMRNNRISNSGKIGILFRDENRGRDFWANRNLLDGNTIIDSGGEQGVGIDITGKTHDVSIVRNVIQETRAAAQRVGIRIGPQVNNARLQDNRIEGVATPIQRL